MATKTIEVVEASNGSPAQVEPTLTISGDEPEIVYPKEISLANASAACQHLLEFLTNCNEKLRNRYRLELRPTKEYWNVRLKLDGVEWFDDLRTKLRNDADCRKRVRCYYNKICEVARNTDVQSSSNYRRIKLEKYCFKADCTYRHSTDKETVKKPCDYWKRPTLMKPCMQKMNRTDGSNVTCFFFLVDEAVIKPEDDYSKKLVAAAAGGKFILGSRREPTRDILLVPQAHTENTKLVVDGNTWKVVHEIVSVLNSLIDKPPVELIAVNFGKWETANSKANEDDPGRYAMNCHGHIHLHFSRLAIDTLSKFTGCSGLQGCVENPENYNELDAKDVFSTRLLPLENSTILQGISDLETRMTAMDGKIDAMTTAMDGKIDAMTTAMDGKIDAMTTAMEAMDGKIDAMTTAMDGKIDALTTAMDGKIKAMDGKINTIDGKIDTLIAMLTRR